MRARLGGRRTAEPPTWARAPGAVLAGIQQGRPGNGCGQGGDFAQHDLNDVADGGGGILGPTGALQPAIDEQLQQVEGEGPKQQDGQQGIGGMAKYMSEVPVLDPLVESGILDVPAGSSDLQCRPAGHPARPLAEDDKAPSRRGLVGLGKHGPDYPQLSLIGSQGIDVVGIPELNLLLAIGIVVGFARWLTLPEGEGFLEGFVGFPV